MKKLISLLLAIILIATSVTAAFAAKPIPEYDHNCLTDCKGECEYSPIIVVHGIMQSQVYVQDKEGNDVLTSDIVLLFTDQKEGHRTAKLPDSITGLLMPVYDCL